MDVKPSEIVCLHNLQSLLPLTRQRNRGSHRKMQTSLWCRCGLSAACQARGTLLHPCSYLPEALGSPGLGGLFPQDSWTVPSHVLPRSSCDLSPEHTCTQGPSGSSHSATFCGWFHTMIPPPLYGPRMTFKFTFLYHKLFS